MRVIAFLFVTLALTTVHCADQTFRIQDIDGTVAYLFNMTGSAALVRNPPLNVTVGDKITFRIETILSEDTAFGLTDGFGRSASDFSSVALGGLRASSSCRNASIPNAWLTTNVSDPCIITWSVYQPAQGEETIYYTAKVKAITSTITIASTTTASSTGTTTAPPTSGNSTTAPPSTPAPSSSTGKSGAAVIVPGAAAFIIAAINAIVA